MPSAGAGETAEGPSFQQPGVDQGLAVGEGLVPDSLGPEGSLGPAEDAGLGAAEVVYPNLGSQLSELAVVSAVGGEAALDGGRAQSGGANGTGSVEALLLTVLLDGNRDDVLEFLADNGVAPANAVGDYLEVYLPPALLGPLARQAGVSWVREMPHPVKDRGDVAGQGARGHGALVWHGNGWTGDGVKVGVIDIASTRRSKDGFTGLRALMGTDLPATVVGRCYTDVGKPTSDLANCDTAGGSDHGTSVAESLMDVAPDAALYVANPTTWADLHSAVVWMHGQGVRVINKSLTWAWHGAADGTSPFATSPLNTVKWAAENGITWVNSAGNQAKLAWYGAFADSDGDGWHEWAVDGTGPDEAQMLQLRPGSAAWVEVRWDDSWGGSARDLDMEVRYSASIDGAQTVVQASADIQNGGAGHYPHEMMTLRASSGGYYWVYLKKKAASAVPSWVQFRVITDSLSSIEHFTAAGGISTPADSASPGMLAVGAAHFDAGGALALTSFSSRGPTPDGRTKPDVVGLNCSPTSSYRSFCGTSQAAPHVAGLAALVIERNPAFSPAQVTAYLRAHAADHGEPGVDSLWGAGFVRLPEEGLTLPDVACTAVLAGSGTVSGAWDQHCVSDAADGMLGRWYSFATDQQRSVTVEVSSAAGTVVRLRRGGDARQGPSLHTAVGSEGSPARISAADLPADDYTIEVSSERPGRVGSFGLKVGGVPTLVPSGSRISIAAGADVTEGDDAAFTVTASPPPPAPLTVWVNAAGRGAFGAAEGRQPVTVSTSGSGTLVLSTADDSADEPDGSVAAAVDASPRYTVSPSAASASVAVSDDDDPLPPPVPGDECVSALTGNGSFEAAWTGDCDSIYRGGSLRGHPRLRDRAIHARYYTFTLDSPARVTIDLESAWESLPEWVDNYLYLRSGKGAKDGPPLVENDDGGDRHFDARIDTRLAAGDYTIEATTLFSSVTSRFRLTVTGLPGTAAPTPVVSIAAGADVTEGGAAVFTVSASPAPAADLDVSVTVSDSGDFASTGQTGSRQVTIGAGETSATLTVATSDDDVDEADGSVTATVVAGAGYTVSAAQGVASVAVSDDDAALGGYVVDAGVVARVRALAAQAEHGAVHVNRWSRVLVAFGVLDGAGVSGGAMDAAEAQQMADAHSSPVWDEVVAELTALEASRQQTPPVADDDDPVPVVSVSGVGVGVVEGRSVWFEVSAVPAPSVGDRLLVGAVVSVSGGAVVDGVSAGEASLVWVSSGTVLVRVGTVNDLVAGGGGAVSLGLLAGDGYVLGADVSATVAVSDDDAGRSGPLVEVAAVGEGVFEGEDAVFSVSVPSAVTAPLSVAVDVSGVQAAGVSARTETVTIAAGQASAVLRVGTSDDAVFGGHGRVEAAVASGSGYRAGLASVADVTVLDDDVAGFSVSRVSIAGGARVSEGGQAVFTLSASPAPAWDVEALVDVEVRDGDGRLVWARTETVTIAAGTTAAVLEVAAAQDSVDNAGHGTVTAAVTRGHALGYRYGDPLSATVRVADDEDPEPPAVAGCAAGVLPALSISSPRASRSERSVDFEVSLGCKPAGRPTILVAPLRDGILGRNIAVSLSADRTAAAVTVPIGAERQLALALVWGTGLANRTAQGNVDYTD